MAGAEQGSGSNIRLPLTSGLWQKRMKQDAKEALIYVVDDEQSARESLTSLLESSGFSVMVFSSASEFLNTKRPDRVSCVLLDLSLPDGNGLDVQQQLLGPLALPVIFITGYGDIPSSVRAMKAGAVEFLPKPFQKEHLIRAIHEALDRDRTARQERERVEQV